MMKKSRFPTLAGSPLTRFERKPADVVFDLFRDSFRHGIAPAFAVYSAQRIVLLKQQGRNQLTP